MTDAARAVSRARRRRPAAGRGVPRPGGARPHRRARADAGRQGGARARAGPAARRACSPTPPPARTSSTRCCAPRRRRSSASTTSAPPGSPTSAPRTCAARGARACSSCATRATSTPRTTARCRPPRSRSTSRCSTRRSRSASSAAASSSTRATPAGASSAPGINLTLPVPRAGLLPLLHRPRPRLRQQALRGLSSEVHRPAEPEQTTEKLWIAAVETYAIGGACQLLHVVDHVIAERGARLFLPARKEGIIPGASNLRLPRAVGERLARQAILSGREFVAGTREGDLLVDETVEAEEVDARDRRPRRGAHQLGAGQRRRQPARAARRPGAARDLPGLHGHLLRASRRSATSARRWWRTSSATGTRRSAAVSDVERWPREQLRALQLERLRETVERVLGGASPLRARLRDAGIDVGRGDRLARRPRAACRSPTRPTCASTTRSGCWPSRASGSRACTRRAAPAASRPSSATRAATSTCGPR